MIPQIIKNISTDTDIFGMIPKHFNALEVVAAATHRAREITSEPDRHTYLVAVPAYLKALPSCVETAIGIVKADASKILSIPGISADYAKLAEAQEALEQAQAIVAEAEMIQGRRLARIHVLEEVVITAGREIEAWDIDFAGAEKNAENLILQHWGTSPVPGPFEDLAKIPVLRRLAPQAIASAQARIDIAQKELADLRAKAPK